MLHFLTFESLLFVPNWFMDIDLKQRELKENKREAQWNGGFKYQELRFFSRT
jgi:hypothetical protein